jgi:hypothetical protein
MAKRLLGIVIHYAPLRFCMSIGVLAVTALLFSASSAGAVQSRNSRSYLVGHRFTDAYVVRLQSAEKSHTVVIPVSNSKNVCVALKKNDSAFARNGDRWIAGCVSSVRDVVFVNPKDIPNGKSGAVGGKIVAGRATSSSG